MARASRSVRLTASLAASLAFVGAAPSLALAHTLLENPPPLTDDDGAKVAPCGCVFGGTPACPAAYNTMTVTAGEELIVSWVETINHPGSFTIKIVPSSVESVVAGLLDAAPALVDMEDTNETAGATITATITVPEMSCPDGNCTLQLVQNMSDSGDAYYSCAAINIVPPGGGTGGGGGVGGGAGVGGGGAATSTGAGNQGEGGAPVWEPEPLDSGCTVSPLGGRSFGVGLVLSALAGLALVGRRQRS